VIYFNGDGDNHVRAIQVEDGVAVETAQGRFSLALPLPGQHNLSNALAATAVCLALDIPLGLIKSGLEAVQPVPGRLSLKHASRGWTVIDDTYNANPASLYAALQVLAGQHGEPWLVMGDMKELGSDSRKLHAELGDAARSLGVKRLFAVGEASAAAVDAFGDHAEHFDSREGLIDALRAELRPGVTCLVKGSRSMGMEHVVKAISNGQDYLEATG
jgi:UDP-N-acetylmuramoyl-tripeptide--D-alanyl-D-alanine ligase